VVGPLLAQVKVRGTLRERSVEPLLRRLDEVRRRPKFRGLLLDISSGGGEVVASQDLYLGVKRVAAAKPVVASVGSLAASGAYLVALGAHRIFAYEESEVGSIGVVLPHIAVQGLLDRLGIQVELLHQGRHKDAYQGLRPLTDEEREKLGRVTEVIYQSFIDTVARERRMARERVLPLATGEFWTGRQALGLGLIDALGDREAAWEELARSTGISSRRRVELSPPRPLLERLLGGPLGSFGRGVGEGLGTSLGDRFSDLWMRGGRFR
jgi:protease-4